MNKKNINQINNLSIPQKKKSSSQVEKISLNFPPYFRRFQNKIKSIPTIII